MSDTTRRSVLTTVVAAGTVALAGCSTGGGGSQGSNVITGTEVVEDEQIPDQLNLAVDLVDEHGIDELTLQSPDGDVVADATVDPAQTQAELFIHGQGRSVRDDTYTIVAYSGDSVVDQIEWTPETGIDITGGSVGNFNEQLIIEVEPTGSIPLTPTAAYLTDGYVVGEEDDRAGEALGLAEIDPYRDNNVVSITGSSGTLLRPPEGSCDGSDYQLTGAIEFENRNPVTFEVTLTMGGEVDPTPSGDVCSEAAVQNITKL
ncbi:hypothetical protein [Halonotius aquaticus]|uniref:hypothetical protein n=1 Tax=Halonotius aquaticus TaxID=2216978 RepID=UPI001058502C|nr:hypothetical protein [Halonotius aquaticus]